MPSCRASAWTLINLKRPRTWRRPHLGSEADIWAGLQLACFVPIVLKNSFSPIIENSQSCWCASIASTREGPHQSPQKRPPALVLVLQSLAVAEFTHMRHLARFLKPPDFRVFQHNLPKAEMQPCRALSAPAFGKVPWCLVPTLHWSPTIRPSVSRGYHTPTALLKCKIPAVWVATARAALRHRDASSYTLDCRPDRNRSAYRMFRKTSLRS
jgi:hypothetical protein